MTSRSKPSSSDWKAGNSSECPGVTVPARSGTVTQGCRRRHLSNRGRSHEPIPSEHVSRCVLALVLSAGGSDLRRLLPHADGDLVLLRVHPLDPVRLGVDRIRELRTVLQGTGADQRTAEHDHLCRCHEQPQGRARSAAGGAAHVEDPRTRPAALDGVLSRARQHGRDRRDLRASCCIRRTASSTWRSTSSASTARPG